MALWFSGACVLKYLAIALTILVSVLAFSPVCEPLTADFVAGFNPPIEQRTDKDFYMLVFQQRDGNWHQCKSRISRAMFF